jgi:hypothetical protein
MEDVLYSLHTSPHAEAFRVALAARMPGYRADDLLKLNARRWTALFVANTYGGNVNLRIDRVDDALRIISGKLRDLRRMQPEMPLEIAPFGPPTVASLEKIRAKQGEQAMRSAMHFKSGGILVW